MIGCLNICIQMDSRLAECTMDCESDRQVTPKERLQCKKSTQHKVTEKHDTMHKFNYHGKQTQHIKWQSRVFFSYQWVFCGLKELSIGDPLLSDPKFLLGASFVYHHWKQSVSLASALEMTYAGCTDAQMDLLRTTMSRKWSDKSHSFLLKKRITGLGNRL